MESFFQNLGDNKPAYYWSGTSLWCRSEMHSLILALTWNVKLVNIERQLTHMLFANFHERVCQRLDIEKQFQWAKEGVYMLTQTMASEKPFLPRLSCFLMTQGTSLVNLFLDLIRISNIIERTCLDVVQGGWKYGVYSSSATYCTTSGAKYDICRSYHCVYNVIPHKVCCFSYEQSSFGKKCWAYLCHGRWY